MKVLLFAVATLTLAVSYSDAHHRHNYWSTAEYSYVDSEITATLGALWNTTYEFSCLGKYVSGELIEYPDNCRKFLSCVANHIIELNCPDGNYFSVAQGMCEIDTANICPACTTPPTSNCTENVCTNVANTDTVADPLNCTNYYMCLGNLAIPQSCLIGQYYDPTQSACVYDENATCINPCPQIAGQLYLPNPNCDKFYLCIDGNVTVNTCTQGSFDAISGECSLSATCITALCVNQPDWVTYAVPGLTSVFYQCDNQAVVLGRCDPNMAYSEVIGACMPAPSSDCDQTVCTSATYDGNAFATISGAASSYCYCSDGAAYEESCATDYVFSTTLDICVSNATCDPDFCLTAADYTVTASKSENSFCLCVSKVPVVVDCPLNSTFNTETLQCQATGLCDSTYCVDQPDYTIYPSDDTNAGYCMCTNETGKFSACEAGETFDTTLNICRPSSVVASFGCDVTICATRRMPIFGIRNDPFNFCYCKSAKNVIQRTCPPDTFFDATLLMCVSRKGAVAASTLGCDIAACSRARNGRVYSIPAKTTDKSFCYCLSPEKVISLDCPLGKRYSNRLGVCVEIGQLNYLQPLSTDPLSVWGPTGENNICPGGHKHGDFVEHAQDCRRFYICAKGQLNLMDCGVGNYYDHYTHVCDWDRYGLCVPATETGCMGLYHEGDMLGHNTNRQLYFICYKQQMIMQDCGPNNIFDNKIQVCVRKDQQNNNNSNNRKHLSRSPRSIVAAPVMAEHSMEEKDSHCDENAKRSVPSNCSQYELCVEGAWQRHTCKHQRYYNPEQQKCLEPRDDYICAHARVSGLPLCNNTTWHQTQPHKHGKCNSYYRCQLDGKWSMLTCPKRQFYATQMNACIETKHNTTICLNHNATETLATATATTTIADVIVAEKCQHTAVRHFEADCGMYLMCLEGEWWHNYCGYGMYFNRTLNTCLLRVGTENCSSSSSSSSGGSGGSMQYTANTATCVTGVRRAFPFNCSAYEMCDAQTQWQRENCPHDYAFDDMLLECVPQAEYVLCSTNGLRRACREGQTRALLLPPPPPATASTSNSSITNSSTNNSMNNTNSNRTHFYYCESERWQLGACLTNQSYSPALAACTPLEWWQNNNTTNTTNITTNTIVIPSGGVENLCSDLTHGARLPHELYCNLFYACVHNATFLAQCPTGEHFDMELKRCNVANVTTFDCREAQLSPTNTTTADAQQICQNQTVGIQLPHVGDCTRYYKCNANSSQPELLACKAGTYYNAEQKMCTTTDGACPYVQNVTALLTAVPKETNAIACADKHGVLLADTNNCNDFYVCLNGRAKHESCYVAHYFNATLRQCQSLPPTSAAASTSNDDDNTKYLNANATQNATQMCAHKRRSHSEMCAELAAGGMLAVPGDCRRYISCQQQADGSAQIEQRCRNGENYDTLLGRCRQSDGTCHLENGQRIGECNSHHGQLVAQTRHCRGYFMCLHGQKIEMFCESHEYFDAKQLVCVKDELKQCKDDIPMQRIAVWPLLNCLDLTESESMMFYGNSLDECRSFYQCVDGVPQLHYCPMDLYFDNVQQNCLPAKFVNCA